MSSAAQRLFKGGPNESSSSASPTMPSSFSRLDGLNTLDAFLGAPSTGADDLGLGSGNSGLDIWLGTTFSSDIEVGGDGSAMIRPGAAFMDPFDLGLPSTSAPSAPRFNPQRQLPTSFAVDPQSVFAVPQLPPPPPTVDDQPIPVIPTSAPVSAPATPPRTSSRRVAAVPELKRRRTSTASTAAAPLTASLVGPGEDDDDEDFVAPEDEREVGHVAVVKENSRRARNTEASARFRARKKQRIEDMKRETEELRNTVNRLESEAGRLRTENAYLRGLLVEKNSNASSRA